MKIPGRGEGLPSVATRPVGTNYSNLDFRDGTETLQRGIGAVGAGVDAVSKANAEAKSKADALVEAEAAYQLDARAQARLTQFRQAKGLKAAETSADLFKGLEKDRDEVAKGIGSASARQRFLARSFESLTAYRRNGEGHVSAQLGAAREETLNAREGQAIGLAESGADPEGFLILSKQVEEDIRKNAVSPGAADARVAEFKSKTGLAITQGLIAGGRLEEAQGYVDEARKFLGGRYVEAKTLLDKAMAGAKHDGLVVEMQKFVDDRIATIKAEPGGYLSEEQIRKAVPSEGYDADSARIVEDRIRERSAEETRRRTADTNLERDNANRADLNRQAIPGATWKYLEKYDPDFLLAREARRQAQHDRWLARQNGSPAERKKAEDDQKSDDEAFRWRLKREVTVDPNVDPRDVETRFVAEKKKLYGRNVAISDPERERAGATVVEERKKATMKEGAEAKANATRIEKVIVAAAKKRLGKGEKLDPAAINDEVGRDLEIYDARVRANGGKPLDEAGWTNFESFIADDIILTKPGRLYGTDEQVVGRPGQQPKAGPEYRPQPRADVGTGGVTKMRFPDGSVHDVKPEDVSRAQKKGGVPFNG